MPNLVPGETNPRIAQQLSPKQIFLSVVFFEECKHSGLDNFCSILEVDFLHAEFDITVVVIEVHVERFWAGKFG